jgi:hypothetical protein
LPTLVCQVEGLGNGQCCCLGLKVQNILYQTTRF